MQSGNGMTMQEAEQEIKYYQKIFQVARLLKGEDVERTFYQQGKGTCENVQDGCPCYSLWKKNGKCENCSSYKALREKKQMIKLEFLESEVYQVISRYMEIDGQPYVMELINHLEDDTLIDISCREKLINKLTGYNEKLYKDVLTGVYNRLYFEEEIKMWTGNAGIVVIDVDDFKLCNDTYGHLTGDMALAAVAGVIWRCIRREDTLVRLLSYCKRAFCTALLFWRLSKIGMFMFTPIILFQPYFICLLQLLSLALFVILPIDALRLMVGR